MNLSHAVAIVLHELNQCLEKDAKEISNSGFVIKNRNQKEIIISIKKDFIKPKLKEILNKFDIEDIFINEPPVDEIIGNILVNGKR